MTWYFSVKFMGTTFGVKSSVSLYNYESCWWFFLIKRIYLLVLNISRIDSLISIIDAKLLSELVDEFEEYFVWNRKFILMDVIG